MDELALSYTIVGMADEVIAKARLYRSILQESPEKIGEIEIKVKKLQDDLNRCIDLLEKLNGVD